MTRKRYIKLLMSHGVSRNEANRAAKAVPKTINSYAMDYVEYLDILESIQLMFDSISKIL